MPPALRMGSWPSYFVSGMFTEPVSVRSTNTICSPKSALSTECTTIVGVVFGTLTVPISHAVSAAVADRNAARHHPLELNRDIGRRENGKRILRGACPE